MIKLLGGALYQWDSNRYVVIEGEDEAISEVHFAKYGCPERALVVLISELEGKHVAQIPNSLLAEGWDICAWEWDGEKTISGIRFPVTRRNCPEDYVYVPSEVRTFDALKEWVKDEVDTFKVSVASDYEALQNKPTINGIEIDGDISLEELGVVAASDSEIKAIFD